MMDWDAIADKLNAKLDPKHVKKPTGSFGPKGDYIEGWFAIGEANEVFGHGNWSYMIKALDQASLIEAKDSKGNPQWQAAYTCIVTVQVGDTFREDVGFGSGFAKQIGDAVEGATKEAVTDALKRCLRTYGWRFGLALYDKSRENVGASEPSRPDASKIRDQMKGAIEGARKLVNLHAIENDPRFRKDMDLLIEHDQPKANEVRTALEGKRSALSGDPSMQAPAGHAYQ